MTEDPRTVEDPPVQRRSRLVLLGGAVAAVGLVGVWLAATTGRLDSALLFVGLPCLMAFAVGAVQSRGGWGTLFQVVTVVLLLASALLHEGALCVLIASPLVYGFAALVYGLSRAVRPGTRYAALPLLALVSLEGVAPGARVLPDQQAYADQVVAAQCSTFTATLERGPRIDPGQDRGTLLQVAKYPTPTAVTGQGWQEGDIWRLRMPDGVIRTEITRATPGRVDFRVLSDTARTTRWIQLHRGSLSWQQQDRGCVADVRIDYRRKLDPAFWFGPVTDVFMDAGAAALLAGLD